MFFSEKGGMILGRSLEKRGKVKRIKKGNVWVNLKKYLLLVGIIIILLLEFKICRGKVYDNSVM